MPKTDYSTWLTKQQAADAIGVSTKTIEKLAGEKQLQQARWKRPETGATVSVYHPDDVARIRRERNPNAEPFVMPADEPAPAANGTALTRVAPMENFFQAFLDAVGSQSSRKSEVRAAERLFLGIVEASEYSGLPQSHLRQLMKDGKLEALKTGAGWRIRRADLERL